MPYRLILYLFLNLLLSSLPPPFPVIPRLSRYYDVILFLAIFNSLPAQTSSADSMRHSDAPPTSAAAANVPLPPAANASAHLRSKYSATHISKLKDLGYKEADVLNALEASGGNLNQVSYFVWVMLIIDSAFLIIFQLELEPHFRFECLFYSISLVFHSDPTCQSAEWLLANAQYQAAGQTPSDQAEAGTSSANATPAETPSGASR